MKREIKHKDKSRNYAAIKQFFDKLNVVDIAAELENMDEELMLRIFRMLPKNKAAGVFAYLSKDVQQSIVEAITDQEINGIVDDMFADDVVDFIEEMPANVVKRVLAHTSKEKRDIINQLLKYPKDSAGSLMTVEFVDLKPDYTVADAFDAIRKNGVDKETIYTCYVIDHDHKLIGEVSTRTLLLSEHNRKVSELMNKNAIFARTTDDKETLSIKFRKYGFLAIPVADDENRLVGIVTMDDGFELQEQEATEDFELMAAVSPSEEPYLKTSVWKLTKNRIVWLLLLMLSAALTGSIISGFEDALAALPALVAFIPMLMDTGGNSGSQSSTLIIRGMALEEIKMSNIGEVLWKELRVAILCGAVLVAVNFVRVILTTGDMLMTITVSLALYATVIMAKTIGCLLPICAKRFGMDPAVMASPVITTIVDAAALFVYFSLARLLLHI